MRLCFLCVFPRGLEKVPLGKALKKGNQADLSEFNETADAAHPMTQRIVVMFAYHFPPENAIGGMRPYRFQKYLSRMGYRCHVFTAANQHSRQDPDCEFIPDPFETRPRGGMGWQIERAVRKFLVPAGSGIQWSRLAFHAAQRFLRSNPAAEVTIVSSYPPIGAHLAALQLSRVTGLPWIADYRDPMADSPGRELYSSSFQLEVLRKFERLCFKTASASIANTDAIAEGWGALYPGRRNSIHVIWNGFDPEDRIDALPIPDRGYRLFTHLGELYEGREMIGLLESVSRLIEAGRIDPRSLRIEHYGSAKDSLLPSKEFLARAKAQGWLEIFPDRIPHAQAKMLMQTSDGLLLVQPHSALQVPGKLFEYLQIGRPILAYIPRNTPIERVLAKSGVPYRCAFVGDLAGDFDEAVERFFSLPSASTPPSDWFNLNLDGSRQTETLARIIESLSSRGPTGCGADGVELTEPAGNAVAWRDSAVVANEQPGGPIRPDLSGTLVKPHN